MNPLSIKARNYRTFDELDLDLPTGCVAILGENGAGKSSIVNVIDLALFGPESRTLADCLSDDAVEENLVIEMVFEHGGQVYRVRRTYSPRGRGTTKLDLERAADGGADYEQKYSGEIFSPLTRETAAATQTAIEDLIGLSRETFRASAFLAQGDGAAFSEAQPRDRKRILGEVLGLDLWDRLLERARNDRRAGELELVQVETTVAGAEAELTGRQVVEDERTAAIVTRASAEGQIGRAEAELTTVNEQVARTKAMQAASASAEQALEAARRAHGEGLTRESGLRHELEQLQERLTGREALQTLSGQLPTLEETRARLQQRTQEADEHERLVVERNRLLGEASDRNEKAQVLRDHGQHVMRAVGEATCDRCGQILGADAAKLSMQKDILDAVQLDKEATGLDEQAAQLTARIETLTAERPTPEELAWVHDQIQRAQHAREQLAALDEAASRLTPLDEQLAECRGNLPVLETSVREAQANLRALLPEDGALSIVELDEQQRDLTSMVTGFRNTLTAAAETIARCDERLDRMSRLAEAVKLNGARRDELHGEIDLLCELERAYGKDGIPALIVESVAIPQLEVEASRILTVLGGAATQVELRTQRELKSGDGVREALDIVLLTDTGERDYSTFSGGERTRIDLALRLALAKLLADRRGAESRVLVIDEPDGLDAQGFAALVEILNGLQDTFSKILVVSHHPDLRHAFDQSIEIVKDGNRSRVETGVEAEAVPA